MSRIVLVGCGKSKSAERVPARDLYTGSLFAARRKYAEATGSPWYIVSAKHGLLPPATLVEPYDTTIADLHPVDRACWPLVVVQDLLSDLFSEQTRAVFRGQKYVLRELVVEIHAGADYAEMLVPIIVAVGANFHWPTKGLSQGEQMQWYKHETSKAKIFLNLEGVAS